MLEQLVLKEVVMLFGMADAGISAFFLVAMTIIFYKYKDVKTRLSSGEKKSDQIMQKISEHVSECNKKGEEAHKIRCNMQSQLSRIEGYLEAKKKK